MKSRNKGLKPPNHVQILYTKNSTTCHTPSTCSRTRQYNIHDDDNNFFVVLPLPFPLRLGCFMSAATIGPMDFWTLRDFPETLGDAPRTPDFGAYVVLKSRCAAPTGELQLVRGYAGVAVQ